MITLTRIWKMSEAELIELIIKNPKNDYAKAFASSIQLGQYNQLYTYIHCIAAMNNYDSLIDIEKQIVLSTNFHNSEGNFINSLALTCPKLTLDMFYSINQDMLDEIYLKFCNDYSRFKNKEMMIFYFFGVRNLLSEELDVYYKFFSTKFSYYNFVKTIKQFIEIYDSDKKLLYLIHNIKPLVRKVDSTITLERKKILENFDKRDIERFEITKNELIQKYSNATSYFKPILAYFIIKFAEIKCGNSTNKSFIFELFDTSFFCEMILLFSTSKDYENNFEYLELITKSNFFTNCSILGSKMVSGLIKIFLNFIIYNKDSEKIKLVISDLDKFYDLFFEQSSLTEKKIRIINYSLEIILENVLKMLLNLSYIDVNYIVNYFVTKNRIQNLENFNYEFDLIIRIQNLFPFPDILPKINYNNRIKYIDYFYKLCKSASESNIGTLIRISYINNAEIIFNQLNSLFELKNNYVNVSDLKTNYYNKLFGYLIYHNKLLLPSDELFKFYVSPDNIQIPIIKNINTHIAKICLFMLKYKNLHFTIKKHLVTILLNVETESDFNLVINEILNHEGIDRNANGNNQYRNGVNVHGDNRDNLTDKCINVLFETYNLSDEEIDRSFDNFWQYSMKLDPDNKILLLRVLGVDENRNPVRGENTDFGGLLTGDVVVGGNTVTTKKFIAYFWHFSNTFKDETCGEDEDCIESERENVKYGLLRGLISSLQDDRSLEDIRNGVSRSHVVCNPGKIQRLVVSTLQGRLKDKNGNYVYVDKEAIQIKQVEEKKEENDEENIDNRPIINYNEIKRHLQNFIQHASLVENLTLEKFLEDLFEYLRSLEENDIILSTGSVIYYISMMSETQDGLCILPELSIISNFEDTFPIDDFKQKFLASDKEIFDNQNPEIVRARNLRLEKRNINQEMMNMRKNDFRY